MKKFFSVIFNIIISLFIISILTVVIYKYVDPPVTPIILIRGFEGLVEGDFSGVKRVWKRYDDISPNLFRAVIGSEDGRFMRHTGIDWKAVKNAQAYNKAHEGVKKRGASTITMQTAKNTFLTHSRVMVRKAIEAYFTYLIEAIWGKKRILEVYANVVEWGDGIYGAEAAAQEFFHKPAKNLTAREAALMAAVLPNPRRWSPAEPTGYIEGRASWIMGRMGAAIPKSKNSNK